jgi:UrcA family protein
MTRSGLRSAWVYAIGAVSAAGLAIVIGVAPPAKAASTVEELTVVGRTKSIPETASYRVSYADLDLSTPDGQKELDRRVRVAAEYVCGQLNSGLDVQTCVTNSMRDAGRKSQQAQKTQPHPFVAGATWVAPPGKK